MDGLSVIIPSRNEEYLEPTIRNVLENARGEIEILVVLDGWLPEPKIDVEDDRVIFFHFKDSIGQRQSINYAARRARGKYVMKLDAHCAVDEGFDVKLAADCEFDWTVIPRMYNLDINTFKPKLHKRTDYMYMRVRDNGQFRAEYYTGKEYRKWHRKEELIDDTMCCMGPCFFMHKDRFWQLGGCDENHGGWGSQGIEVSCKAWLSGGALKVNKKTWFSHWFRGGGGPGFPYKISGRQVEHARKYAKDLWINNKWPLAKREFTWLIEKFDPPGWNEKDYHMRKFGPNKPRGFISHIHGRTMRVANLIQNIEHYWDPRRQKRAKQYDKVIKFFADLHHGKEFKTDDDLRAHPYYDYVKSGYKKEHERAVLNIMKDSIKLYHDIKENGMRDPIDMWVEGGKYNLSRGSRRIAILYALGQKWTGVRMYHNEDFMEKFRASEIGVSGLYTETAQKQFREWNWKTTDKYWIHGYTPLYDLHCEYLKDREDVKILEVGVSRGASLRLWQEALPKAQIYGVDIKIEPARMAKKIERITLLEGSQVDKEFNEKEVIPLGKFDLIVDDASHKPQHQREGFEILWDSVKPGGFYVVEDMYYMNFNPRKENKNFFQKLSDTIVEQQHKCDIEAIYLYYNIVFIKKRNYGK